MSRPKGVKNRNYPPVSLSKALAVPNAIQHQASGMSISRLTLADLLAMTPGSSQFRELIAAAHHYGLITGGVNSSEFGLSERGQDATGVDSAAKSEAFKTAVTSIAPFGVFFNTFDGKKVPGDPAFREFLIKSADVPAERASECKDHILADAQTAGLLRAVKGGSYVELNGAPSQAGSRDDNPAEPLSEDPEGAFDESSQWDEDSRRSAVPETGVADKAAKKVFIAHGSHQTPLDQLKKALDQFKVEYVVAVDEPNKGRPISKKVAQLMRDECSSGIFIFTADEHFKREDGSGEMVDVWRPRENVVYELGAASILYENRIVIFKEKEVTFPTDFSDLGYIEFVKDRLVAEVGALFGELVALDILEVRAKG